MKKFFDKFGEILKPIAWTILVFTAGMTTKVFVTVREKEKHVMCQPVVQRADNLEKSVFLFNNGIITNIVKTYGIPVLLSNPPKLVYPEAYWVTNLVYSKVCKKCGGHADWQPGDEFNNSGKKQPTCQCYAVYPPMQCEYGVIETNVEQCIRWAEQLDLSKEANGF